MDWIARLNRSIDYIEEHLGDEIDPRKLAEITYCSSFHYQRMFSFIAGVPLSEYIRRRRMTLAAVDLQAGEKVLDVALKYGYNSPTAFNRAFQALHNVPPSLARQKGVLLKSFPAISFKISIKGVEKMNYRIENKEAFRIVGKSMPLEQDIEKNFKTVPAMWDNLAKEGSLQKLVSLMNAQPQGVLGVSACDTEKDWRYFIAVASKEACPEGFEEFHVPAASFAVFSGEGPATSIQDLERRIVSEWLPASGYEYGNAPDIEVYLNPDPANAKYEVWIPVVKRK